MWMNEYIAARSFDREEAALGEVETAANGCVSVSATRDYHRVPLTAPAGIAYVPARGEKAVVVQSSGGAVCPGVIMAQPSDLEPGELMLFSAGGASIVLKNNGTVLINGREVQ